MSSFHKTSISHTNTKGTKLKNNLTYISSGIPSLDYVIGGGLPAGSVFLVEEDVLGSYSRVLTKYFLAEGVICKHDLFVSSADVHPVDITKELPQACLLPSDEKTGQEASSEMKIAWRYEGLGKVESSFGSNTNFGHHFDLSKYIDENTIRNANITYCHLTQDDNKVNGFKNNLYSNLLSNIKKLVSKEEYNRSSKAKNILRITIQSLGSPIWMALDCDDESPTNYGQDLLKFLYCLRVLTQDKNAVTFITIPSHLFDDDHIIKRALYSVDNAVRIESFAGSSKETNPVYSEYHGLFHIIKLSAVNSLVPFVPPSLDLAFKLRRKKFVIEKLHLPPAATPGQHKGPQPFTAEKYLISEKSILNIKTRDEPEQNEELQESSEREQDDITATPKTCGGFKKKDIDF